jgi:PAS domain S-box-containing protein
VLKVNHPGAGPAYQSGLQNLQKELARAKNAVELLETVLDNIQNGIVVVDRNARIIIFNKAYCDFLEVRKEDMIGRPVVEAIENTRMHIVLQTGVAEIGDVQRIKGHDMICSRIPLKKNGEIWGALGIVMFRDVKDLRTLMRRVERLQSELEFYKDELAREQGARYRLENIVGTSERIQELKRIVLKVARSDSTVLIRGESGTGKELFAHALHNASPRRARPFVRVNCSALPENLLESELFGYREGAFTGARRGGKMGKFELADGGTIFLDEIGDLPVNMQAKLLRVLQEKEIERLGDNQPTKVNVRVIAATNRNLEEMVREGLFRQDLFYRLNVVVLEIPPLRERPEDIPALVASLLAKLTEHLGCSPKRIDEGALECLRKHTWPGNVRELENVLERILNLVEEDVITVHHLPFYLLQEINFIPGEKNVVPLKEAVEKTEKAMLLRALEITGGDRLAAAKILQISKSSLYEKISRYKISS